MPGIGVLSMTVRSPFCGLSGSTKISLLSALPTYTNVAAAAGEAISTPTPSAAMTTIQIAARCAPPMMSSLCSRLARRIGRVQRRSPAKTELGDVAQHVVTRRHHSTLHPRNEIVERLLAYDA